MARASRRDCVLTPQSLSEFFHATTRKRLVPSTDAAEQVSDWIDLFAITPGVSPSGLLRAVEAATAGRFQFYDALLLATAREAGCAAVVSEDMADGAELNGVRVVAPFDGHGGINAQVLHLL